MLGAGGTGRDGFSVMGAAAETRARLVPPRRGMRAGATTLLAGRSPFEVVDGDNPAKTVARAWLAAAQPRIDRPGVPDAVTAIVPPRDEPGS